MSHRFKVNVSCGEWVECETLLDCAKAVRNRITSAGIGNSEWDGTGAITKGDVKLGRVTYSGRVLDAHGREVVL